MHISLYSENWKNLFHYYYKCPDYQNCRESTLRESGDSASSHLLKVKHFIICLLKELNSVKEFKCHITQAK